MTLLDLPTFLGHLHPLVVHLPLGFLLLAFMFHIAARFPKYRHLDQAVAFTLLAGFVSAVIACVSGYVLSLAGDYDRMTLKHHKTAGILLAILSGLLYLISSPRWTWFPRRLLSVGFAGLAVLMLYTGHAGGSLTHGDDYLTLKTLTYQKRKKPLSLEETYLFEDVVHPLLQARCGQCHTGSKRKGGLSMETLEDLFRGGKDGPAIVAGKPDESELYKRITLDPAQEKFMPTDGKTPLRKQEVEIIRWWIGQASATAGKKLLAIKNNEAIRKKVAVYLDLEPGDEGSEELVAQHLNPAIPLKLDSSLVENLRRKGWMVRWMLHAPAMLDVTLPPDANARISDARAELQKLAPNIVWLNLSANNLSDRDLVFLHTFSNLEKLRLEKNPVTDAVCMQLAALSHLEAVNVNETSITEAGMATLKKNAAIKRIYHWSPSK